MKKSYSILLILLLSGFINVFAQTSAEKAVASYISKAAKEQSAEEYTEARKIIYSDLDNDGDKDAVVQYTLEGFGGGNNFSQMLAIFINQKGIYKFAAEDIIGSKMGKYTSTLKSANRKNIYIETESCPEPPQGICETPRKGSLTLNFRNGKITIIRGTKF